MSRHSFSPSAITSFASYLWFWVNSSVSASSTFSSNWISGTLQKIQTKFSRFCKKKNTCRPSAFCLLFHIDCDSLLTNIVSANLVRFYSARTITFNDTLPTHDCNFQTRVTTSLLHSFCIITFKKLCTLSIQLPFQFRLDHLIFLAAFCLNIFMNFESDLLTYSLLQLTSCPAYDPIRPFDLPLALQLTFLATFSELKTNEHIST